MKKAKAAHAPAHAQKQHMRQPALAQKQPLRQPAMVSGGCAAALHPYAAA